jgi:hypothetical protein
VSRADGRDALSGERLDGEGVGEGVPLPQRHDREGGERGV